MRYWWVNQNQTYRHEVPGNYLWSPKRNANGNRNPFYDFMREVAPGDVVLSFADTLIKAIGIADDSDFDAVPGYEAVAEMLIFDSKPPPGAPAGGRAYAFDWQLLRKRMITRPWLLAGGLHTHNVARAIAAAGAPGVDVSSGVESAPGVKDAEAIRAFVEAARRAEAVAGQPP